jgi:hypothetical protein
LLYPYITVVVWQLFFLCVLAASREIIFLYLP